MSDPLRPDNSGDPPPRPVVDTGQSFAVVAARGHILAGGMVPAGPNTQGSVWKSFSTLNTLDGGQLNYNEPKVEIVSRIQFSHFCAFGITRGTTAKQVIDALKEANPGFTQVVQVHVPLNAKVALVGVCDEAELALLKAVTLSIAGIPLPRKRLVEHKKTLTSVTVAGLHAASFENLTRGIVTALSRYGTIHDIVFDATDLYSMGKAKVLIDVTQLDTVIPHSLSLGSQEIFLTGQKVAVFCSYCQEVGHTRDACTGRPEYRRPAQPLGYADPSQSNRPNPATRLTRVPISIANTGNTQSNTGRSSGATERSSSNDDGATSDVPPARKKPKKTPRRSVPVTIGQPSSRASARSEASIVRTLPSDFVRAMVDPNRSPSPDPTTQPASNTQPDQHPLPAQTSQPPAVTSMNNMLSPARTAPAQLATNDGSQIGATGTQTGKRARSPFRFAMPPLMPLPTDPADPVSTAGTVNADPSGMCQTAPSQGNGQSPLGNACAPSGTSGEGVTLSTHSVSEAEGLGEDSAMADEPDPLPAGDGAQPVPPVPPSNEVALVHTEPGASGSTRLLVKKAALDGGGSSA